jgi:hypothetical protein
METILDLRKKTNFDREFELKCGYFVCPQP